MELAEGLELELGSELESESDLELGSELRLEPAEGLELELESEPVQVEVLTEWGAAQQMVFFVYSETQPGLLKFGKNAEQVSDHEKWMVYSLGKDGFAEERTLGAPYDKLISGGPRIWLLHARKLT